MHWEFGHAPMNILTTQTGFDGVSSFFFSHSFILQGGGTWVGSWAWYGRAWPSLASDAHRVQSRVRERLGEQTPHPAGLRSRTLAFGFLFPPPASLSLLPSAAHYSLSLIVWGVNFRISI